MLSDESIDLAQQMLAGQFPQLTGFSDIALTEKNGFDIIPREIPFNYCTLDLCTGYACAI